MGTTEPGETSESGGTSGPQGTPAGAGASNDGSQPLAGSSSAGASVNVPGEEPEASTPEPQTQEPTPAEQPEPTAVAVDCSRLDGDGIELCESTDQGCGVVFNNGIGCSEVCGSAGLQCVTAYENIEGQCAADQERAAIDCDSGHTSDYCLCGSNGTPSEASPEVPEEGGEPEPSTPAIEPEVLVEPEVFVSDGPCAVPSFIQAETVPLGWANESGGTSGGAGANPVLVSSLAELQSEISGNERRTIFVQGELQVGDLKFGSNKTVIGCSSGAHIRGHLGIGSGSSNVILRNLTISGYGAGNCALDPSYDSSEGCSSGSDAISVNGTAHHVWFDHCAVKDGTDGNLDITNDADFVTVSWTIFSYTPRSDNQGDDSTGGAGHRYSNLVGGTNNPPTNWPGVIPLNVTWHHNWWADGVVERQPRVRYGRNHIFNNFYNSSATNYCVRAGIEASILLEGNQFEGTQRPHEFNNSSDETTAFIALGQGSEANLYSGTSGTQATGGGGGPFTPPYAYSVDAAESVKALVTKEAGPH